MQIRKGGILLSIYFFCLFAAIDSTLRAFAKLPFKWSLGFFSLFSILFFQSYIFKRFDLNLRFLRTQKIWMANLIDLFILFPMVLFFGNIKAALLGDEFATGGYPEAVFIVSLLLLKFWRTTFGRQIMGFPKIERNIPFTFILVESLILGSLPLSVVGENNFALIGIFFGLPILIDGKTFLEKRKDRMYGQIE